MDRFDRLAERIARFLLDCSRPAYSRARVVCAMSFGSSMELIVLPAALLFAGKRIDGMLHWDPVASAGVAGASALACFCLGAPWLAWTIYWQHAKGKGTPFPLVPTKALLTDGPYRRCRNPMALGAIFWLAGWAFAANSRASLFGGVGCFAALVLSWDRWIEEKELLLKHGDAYRAYLRRTPFLIPRFD